LTGMPGGFLTQNFTSTDPTGLKLWAETVVV
jgi:hypothetical protein